MDLCNWHKSSCQTLSKAQTYMKNLVQQSPGNATSQALCQSSPNDYSEV